MLRANEPDKEVQDYSWVGRTPLHFSYPLLLPLKQVAAPDGQELVYSNGNGDDDDYHHRHVV